MQQNQLRLDFHIEAARGLEQTHQHLTKGNILERLLENWLADRTDGRFELIELGLCRHPARIDVQLRNATIITFEKGKQVTRQIILIFRGQAADDAAVDGNVLRRPRVDRADENVAGVHVGMEEAVAKNLREEDFHAALGEQFHVGALIRQAGHVGDLQAVDTLHDQHFRAAPVPVDLWHVKQVGAFEVASQLAGVGRFTQQVEFVVDGLFIIHHHLHRVQQAGIGRHALGGAGQNEQPRQVLTDDRLEAGAYHFDHDFFTGLQAGGMHLSDRSGRQRLLVEAAEHVTDARAELFFDQLDRQLLIERRHAVLQQHQFVGDVLGQQIAPCRQQLPELDENRPQVLERQTKAYAPAQLGFTPWQPAPGQHETQREHPPRQGQGEQQVIKAIADNDTLNAKQTADGKQLHALSLVLREWARRAKRASRRSRSSLI